MQKEETKLKWLWKLYKRSPMGFVTIILTLVVVGLAIPLIRPQIAHKKIEGVVRIFMHNRDHYTLLTKTKGSTRLQLVEIEVEPSLIMDLPEKKAMWAYIKTDHSRIIKAEIHLHSVDRINGADWEYGHRSSYRHGHTCVVE